MWIKNSLFLILFTLCSCVSTNYITKESSAFDELNEELKGEKVTVLLTNELELEGIYHELTLKELVIGEVGLEASQTIPTSEIKTIIDRNHTWGFVEGLGLGYIVGGIIAQGVSEIEGGGAYSNQFAGLLIGLPIWVTVTIISAVQGHKYKYVINWSRRVYK